MTSLALSTHLAPKPWDFIEQQARKYFFTISFAQEDALGNIFGYLSAKDLGVAARVCKQWNRLAAADFLWRPENLQDRVSGLRIIDGKTWTTHADCAKLELSVDAPPLDRRVITPILHRMLPAVEGKAGVTLMLMPAGLTFNKIVQLAGAPKEGNQVIFKYLWHRIPAQFGNVAVAKTHWVAITNSVLEGSRNLSVADQQRLVDQMGCEMPGVLEATTLAVLTYMSSSEESPLRLYGNIPWTLTRCQENIQGFRLVVGGFAPDGLRVCFNVGYGIVSIGVGALRKLKAIGP